MLNAKINADKGIIMIDVSGSLGEICADLAVIIEVINKRLDEERKSLFKEIMLAVVQGELPKFDVAEEDFKEKKDGFHLTDNDIEELMRKFKELQED